MAHNLERIDTFSTEDVLNFVPEHSSTRMLKCFAGHKISLSKRRYRLFALKGTSCVQCGIKGTFMALESHRGNQVSHSKKKYHFNVYALNGKGEEIMITADHIVPKARGGSNSLCNLQPMCEPCNVKKADHTETTTCPQSSTTQENSEKSTEKSSDSKSSAPASLLSSS